MLNALGILTRLALELLQLVLKDLLAMLEQLVEPAPLAESGGVLIGDLLRVHSLSVHEQGVTLLANDLECCGEQVHILALAEALRREAISDLRRVQSDFASHSEGTHLLLVVALGHEVNDVQPLDLVFGDHEADGGSLRGRLNCCVESFEKAILLGCGKFESNGTPPTVMVRDLQPSMVNTHLRKCVEAPINRLAC